MPGAFYTVDVLPDITHKTLDAISGLQALPKGGEEAKSVEREGVLQPLLERAHRLPIDLSKLGVEIIGQTLFCSLLRRFLMCPEVSEATFSDRSLGGRGRRIRPECTI